MLLLVQRLALSLKHSSKLENHHHHHPNLPSPSEAASDALHVFQSDVSSRLIQLSTNSNLETGFLSMKWLHQCFQILPIVNNAFAKLVVDIDYPMSKWEVDSIEEYLNCSLNLLDLLNSITSAVSRLGQARVSLSYALSLIENSPSLAAERMKEFQFQFQFQFQFRSEKLTKDEFKLKGNGKSTQERNCYGNEWIVHRALLVMTCTGLWVCGVVLSVLNNDPKPYLEMRKSVYDIFSNTSLMALDSVITEKRGIVKEVKEVNETVADVVSGIANGKGCSAAAKELQTRLELLEIALKGVEKEENDLFSRILAGRNELVETLRQKKQ